MLKSFYMNPYFDELILFMNLELKTSKDGFKIHNCNNCNLELYEMTNKVSKTEYKQIIQDKLNTHKNPNWPFKENLLVQYSVSGSQNRINIVDIDNLAKTLLDCFEGIVYNNDNQIIALAGDKNNVKNFNAFLVAIKRLNNNERSIFQDYLYSEENKTINNTQRFICIDFGSK